MKSGESSALHNGSPEIIKCQAVRQLRCHVVRSPRKWCDSIAFHTCSVGKRETCKAMLQSSTLRVPALHRPADLLLTRVPHKSGPAF